MELESSSSSSTPKEPSPKEPVKSLEVSGSISVILRRCQTTSTSTRAPSDLMPGFNLKNTWTEPTIPEACMRPSVMKTLASPLLGVRYLPSGGKLVLHQEEKGQSGTESTLPWSRRSMCRGIRRNHRIGLMSSTAMLTLLTNKEDAVISVSCHLLTTKIKTQARWPPSDKIQIEITLHRSEEVEEDTPTKVSSNARARRTRGTRLTRRRGSSRSSRPRSRSTTRSMPRSACFQVCRLQPEIRLRNGKREVYLNSRTTKK